MCRPDDAQGDSIPEGEEGRSENVALPDAVPRAEGKDGLGTGPAAAVRQPALPAVHEPHPWEERRSACGHFGQDDTAVDAVKGVVHVEREDHAAQQLRPLRLGRTGRGGQPSDVLDVVDTPASCS